MADLKEAGKGAPTTELTSEQRKAMSERFEHIANLEASRAKIAVLNKKLFDLGLRPDLFCW